MSGRVKAFGAADDLTPVDKFGVWLSGYRIRRAITSFAGLDIADIGCGHEATFVRSVLDDVASATLVDVSLADDLVAHPKVRAVVGKLPGCLEDIDSSTFDVVMCNSALEHLDDPHLAVREFRRLVRPGGTCFINVPTWLGKTFLEFSAFRLGLSPEFEVDDHKRYYDPKELWPLLVEAGFRPKNIVCRRHKFGLNAYAVCRVDG